MNNIIVKWLSENLQRLFQKSPLFFRIWQMVSGALLLITGIPAFLNWLPFDINIPDLFNDKITKLVAGASAGLLFMSLLTTQSKPVGVTEMGKVIKATDPSKLPFTGETEKKEAYKQDLPVVEVKKTNTL